MSYNVSTFGARAGDLLIGEDVSKGITIRVMSDIPPMRKGVEFFINQYGEDKMHNMLQSIPFFRPMSRQQRSEWINANSIDGQGFDDMCDSPTIEVLDISSNPKLSEFVTSSETSIATVKEIQNSLETRTLVFYSHFWIISFEDYEIKKCDLCNNANVIVDGETIKASHVDESLKIYKFKIDDKYTFIATQHPNSCSSSAIVNEWEQETSYFTASGYKSLLQKIIRYSPTSIRLLNDVDYDASKMCGQVFLKLFNHKGSFVPDLNRFVKGSESALKRLAVSIVEDSFVEDPKIIADLLAHTIIAQRVNGWKPSDAKLNEWVSIAEKAVGESRRFEYVTTDLIVMKDDYGINGWELSARLLNIARSFQTDINLLTSIARNCGRFISCDLYDDIKPEYMYIHHCIDQHWAPSIIYLFSSDYVIDHVQSGINPFSTVFGMIWDHVSSLNPRHGTLYDEDSETYYMIDDIQLTFHKHKLGLLESNYGEKLGSEIVEIVYPESWIASRVGPIMISAPHAMVTINPENINMLVATRKPARGNKDSRLTPIDEESAIHKARLRLMGGICGVKLSQDELIYTVDNMPLESFLSRNITVDIFESNCQYMSVSNDAPGMMIDARDKLHDIFDTMSISEINRAIYHIKMSSSILQFPSISRSGGGTKGMVTRDEVSAYKIIGYIASLYPFVLRIKRNDVATFDVFHPTYLRSLGTWMGEQMSNNTSSNWFTDIHDMRKLTPFDHQTETLDQMIDRTNKGNVGNFIWIPVGMGKTYIVCSYLAWLISANKCPDYVVYTLPKSAMTSVIKELESWNFKINTIIPLKNKVWKFDKYRLNVIDHDHLRLIQDDLMGIASDTMFVVDEVHKTLANTQRSGVALNIASLAKLFIVMTGTPMINSDMSLLLNWLRLVVNYPIDSKNFWISINSMISKPVNTGIIVNKQKIFVEFDQKHHKYYDLVGRRLGGNNDHVTNADILKAIDICYDVCNEVMIDLAVDKVDNGVFMVARNVEHQTLLLNMLKNRGIYDVGLVNKDNTWYLEKPGDDGPRIIITTSRKSEGYTLTKMGVMVSSVYFSNLATRQQLSGRINRVSQVRTEIEEILVYAGLLEFVMMKYDSVSNINDIMRELSDH